MFFSVWLTRQKQGAYIRLVLWAFSLYLRYRFPALLACDCLKGTNVGLFPKYLGQMKSKIHPKRSWILSYSPYILCYILSHQYPPVWSFLSTWIAAPGNPVGAYLFYSDSHQLWLRQHQGAYRTIDFRRKRATGWICKYHSVILSCCHFFYGMIYFLSIVWCNHAKHSWGQFS